MVLSATLTTVPSRNAMPEPRTAAAMTERPVTVPIRTASGLEPLTPRKVAFPLMSTLITASSAAERRLVEHVDRLAVEHPPIDLDSVDYAVRNPVEFEARFGHVLDYMARVELE